MSIHCTEMYYATYYIFILTSSSCFVYNAHASAHVGVLMLSKNAFVPPHSDDLRNRTVLLILLLLCLHGAFNSITVVFARCFQFYYCCVCTVLSILLLLCLQSILASLILIGMYILTKCMFSSDPHVMYRLLLIFTIKFQPTYILSIFLLSCSED